MNEFLKVKQDTALAAFQAAFDLTSWKDLSKSIMILFLFNRKRVGEIDTITVEDFTRKLCPDTDIYNSLSETERKFANWYFHLTVRGKLTRPVNLLIMKKLPESINVLLKHRKEAGMSDTNSFLFAKQGNSSLI